MTRNPILDELYAAREKLLADAGGDAHEFLEGVRKRERASGRLLSAEEQRTIRCNAAVESTELPVENLSPPLGDR